MPRIARRDFPGALQHVTDRGNGKQIIFRDAEDCAFFLKKAAALSAELGLIVLSYALMPNHFHFLVETGRVPLAIFMHRLLTSYARVFNDRWNKIGHLFQARYNSELCVDEANVRNVIRYIHRNPVKAGLAPSVELCEWTSHRQVAGIDVCGMIDRARALSFFDGDLQEYLEFMAQPPVEKETPTLSELISTYGEGAMERMLGLGREAEILEMRRDFVAAAVAHGYSFAQLAAFTGRNPTSMSRWLR